MLDILVKTNDGDYINVEIQLRLGLNITSTFAGKIPTVYGFLLAI